LCIGGLRGMVIEFIDNLQVVTKNSYYTIFDLHTTNHSTLCLLSLFPTVFLGNSSPQCLFLCSAFTRYFLVTNLSNGDYFGSVARCLRLHSLTLNCTPLIRSTEQDRPNHIFLERTYRKHHLHHLFYC
jgi:hypothetical protein